MNSTFFGEEPGVAHPMAALIEVEFRLRRLPGRIPDGAAVLDVEVLAVAVIGDIVVAIAGDAQELRILIEGIAAAGVGDQREEVLVPKVVNPGKRRSGCRDDILPVCVIEVSKFHEFPLSRNDND